jgi:exodeoxyribonuclease VII large subunit
MASLPSPQTSIPGKEVYSVYEISGILKEVLEDHRLQDVWIRGEVTNFKCHHSGHCWFSLSEQRNGKIYTLDCVMWKSDVCGLNFSPGNGLDVLAFGYVDHYAPQGKIQLYVRDMRRAGEGEKHLLIERWRRELTTEGLFAAEHKRPLPPFPTCIGVVTSPTGAVIEDIKNVIGRRFPVEILLSPTPVQGDLAYISIAKAIRRIDRQVDVLIVARGGGSFEDLFPFNHPEVVRAVSACHSPVISAIGHEGDVTLCDLAADIRAPTPSAAAELSVRDRTGLLADLQGITTSLKEELMERMERARGLLDETRVHLHPRRLQRRVGERRQELSDFSERLVRTTRSRCERERLLLGGFSATVNGQNPAIPLRRGYCIAMKGDKVVHSVHELAKDDRIALKLHDGKGIAQVEEVTYEENI